jgi:hypothetical protein
MFRLGRYFDPYSYPLFGFMLFPFLLISPSTSYSYPHFHYFYFLLIARIIIGLKKKIKWEMENMQ